MAHLWRRSCLRIAAAAALTLASGPNFASVSVDQEIQLVFHVAYTLADGKGFTHWHPDSEFRATREKLAQPAESK